MSNAAQKAILTAKINGVLKDLIVGTDVTMVMVDENTTLEAKLVELSAALDGKAASTHTHAQGDVTGLEDALTARPTTDAMNSAISAAISNLIGDAPETYDTLKEIADYIAAHQEVVDALNAAIGNKADKSAVNTLQALVDGIKSTVDGLGALATKDKITLADCEDNFKSQITQASAGAHRHDNKNVLDRITSEKVAAWDAKSKVYYSATEPKNMAEGDTWVQLIK